MDIGILGIAYHLPERVESNEDLRLESPDWDLEGFAKQSGICSRHIAAEGETGGDLGCRAAEDLLGHAPVTAEEIDYLIFCSQTPDHFLPPTACILQQRLGLRSHIGAIDLGLGCSGYVYGLQLAKSLVLSGAARNVLLVTGETLSKLLHPRDRSVRPLFGDAGTATLVGWNDRGNVIGEFEVGTDGDGVPNLVVPAGGFRLPCSPDTSLELTDGSGNSRSSNNLFMDGKAIFAFAITAVPGPIRTLIRKAGLEMTDVDWFVFHQANLFILKSLAAKMKIPPERMVVELGDIGNTTSSSIPIALQRWVEAGRIREGHRLVLLGFGVGYSWAACDLKWA